ncbi:MAG: D-alanyl-D-alanine carboxypeptidase family protein [Pseudomonadota bacterium]
MLTRRDNAHARYSAILTNWLLLITILLSTAVPANPLPLPPKLKAGSYLLLAPQSGQILISHNPDQRLPPASLTKIMTAYLVFQSIQQGSLKPDDLVHVSKKAWRTPGSRMFIEVNSQVSVQDLLRGLVVQSGNDAAVALAEHIAGDEANFARMMNSQAQQLGLQNTHFMNATGLPDENHYSTARDLARITDATIQHYPEQYALYAEKTYTYNNISQRNRNTLLWRDASVDGVKTGHTQAAGYCLVAAAERDGMRLISVILGADNKAQRLKESQALLNHGYRFYRTHQVYTAEQTVHQSRAWYGTAEQIPVGPAHTVSATIPRGQYDQLQSQITMGAPLHAPIQKGQILGTLTLTLAEQTLKTIPLIALQDLPEGNLWRQAIDRTLQLLE